MALHPLYGFHGCSRADADRIIRSGEMKKSAKSFEWLGEGFYFWENDPGRALEWAVARKKKDPAVIGALIDSSQCLDLASRDGARLLGLAYEKLKAVYGQAGRPLPKNERGAENDADEVKRHLDCAVLNVLFDGNKVPAVKSPFVEGMPVYPGSKFFEKTHTQICVRNPSCILGMFIVRDAQKWAKLFSMSAGAAD